jgi:hypothetical protein
VPIFATRLRNASEQLTAATVVEPVDPIAAAARAAIDGLFTGNTHVSRILADRVPAYRRSKVLIASNISQLKLLQRRDTTGDLMPSIPFLRRPNPDRIASALWADVVADMADYGIGYLLNPNWGSPDGWRYADSTFTMRKHKSVVNLPFDAIVDTDATSYLIDIDGHQTRVPAWGVLAFECAAGRWLTDGARAITTAITLEDAAREYAKHPAPRVVVTNTGPRKTGEQVDQLMEAFASSGPAVYVGRDISVDPFQMNAQEIALSEARSAVVLDIARLTGVPALYLSQGIADATMTYVNATSARIDLHSAMLPFITAIEERLSFDDVTGEGVHVEFDVAPFLRVDPAMRAQIASALVPIGVMSIDEARAAEGLVVQQGKPA